ncbi:MAG: hypothetical protein HY835_10875 [Anaerolineae bacterium]|nr:hypothetical protein [Anaerolineae bacterium]
MKKLRLLLPLAALMLAALACNFPTLPRTESTLPPLDQTMTALFQTAAAIPPSATAAPLEPTRTLQVIPTQPAQPSPTFTAPLPTATNPPPPTNTLPPPPPPTATRPPVRPGANVEAPYLGTPPVLDGDWSEWKTIAREYPATHVVYGKSSWTGEDDLAGSYYVGWDNTYLYLAVKVRDDKFVQTAEGQNIYKGDSLELLLDTDLNGDFYSTTLSGDDFQLGISPGRPEIASGNAEPYLWFPSSRAGKPSGVIIAARQETGQYRVEVAVPWTALGISPSRGLRLGFALSVSDNDSSGSAVQESMVSSAAGRSLVDPTTWGEVTLK